MIRKLQLKRVEKKSVTKADKSKKPATAKQLKPKPVKEKSSKPAPTRKPKAPGQAHVGSVAIRVPVVEATRPLPVVEGKGKATATEEQAAQSLRTPATEEASTRPSAQPQDDTSINIVCDSPSLADAETGADTDKTNSGGNTKILQIGEEQDLGKTPKSRPPPERILMEEDQAGPDPRLSHVALYAEHIHEENHTKAPLGNTLSMMKAGRIQFQFLTLSTPVTGHSPLNLVPLLPLNAQALLLQ
ncbi:hypothetical protein Tco_0708741 [Tanacetum coccineum]